MNFEAFEDTLDSIIKILAIVAAAVAIGWIVIPGIMLILM